MILVIDNFDSFTYNIVQYLEKLGHKTIVKRNNEITIAEIDNWKPNHLIISPGPSNPDHAGVSMEAIRHFSGKIPILGVCLGHQCIGQVFGGKIIRAKKLYHGKTSQVTHDGRGVFTGLPIPFIAARYHSLVIEKETCPPDLEVTAMSEDGEIMGVRHKTLAVEGVQFHPESIATEGGYAILENFLKKKDSEPFIKNAIKKVFKKQDLTTNEAEDVMEEIGSGSATPAQIAALLTALSAKGETAGEIAGFAGVMRRRAVPVARPKGQLLIDTCGTGGDASGTFNISTLSAFVAAGAGLHVAKHGNRSITSKCGSADQLEALGVSVDLAPDEIAKALEKIGIAFLFAPKLHPAMKHAVPVRKEIGIRTVFNVLGPLANPAGADAQVIGVYEERLVPIIADVLARLGMKRAMVVHGSDGLDEITLTGATKVSELKDGWIQTYDLHPEKLGLTLCQSADLKGDNIETNKKIALEILEGKAGPARDIVLLNAAAALYTADKVGSLEEGLRLAAKSIDSGSAQKKLFALAAFKP